MAPSELQIGAPLSFKAGVHSWCKMWQNVIFCVISSVSPFLMEIWKFLQIRIRRIFRIFAYFSFFYYFFCYFFFQILVFSGFSAKNIKKYGNFENFPKFCQKILSNTTMLFSGVVSKLGRTWYPQNAIGRNIRKEMKSQRRTRNGVYKGYPYQSIFRHVTFPPPPANFAKLVFTASPYQTEILFENVFARRHFVYTRNYD